MINRPKYLKLLINKLNNGSIKIISGLRRSGKSYLLNDIFYSYLLNNVTDSEHIIKFSFDSSIDLEKIEEDLIEIKKEKRKVDYKKFQKYLRTLIIDNEKYYLLLDEVQLLDSFEMMLIGLNGVGQFEIYVTGSNSKFLSSEIVTEFRGKGDEIHLLPLSFTEYYEHCKLDFETAINEYMIYGGLPQVVLSTLEEEKVMYLENQIKKTYLADIVERNNVQGVEELKELFNILSSGISCLISPMKLAKIFSSEKRIKLSEPTISKYIDYFADAFLIKKVNRYNVKGNSYISTPFKIYFEDLGIRNAQINFRQIEYTHLMENLIYNELRYRGFSVDVGEVEIRENGSRKLLEVDFVANSGSNRVYIQSAYEISSQEKQEKETKSLANIKDSFKKVIILRDNIVGHYDENGYLYLSLKEFLTNKDSISR